MANHQNHDRLSRTDSIFLYLESENIPLHIAGMSTLEGIVSFEDCLRFVESKIPLIPRYRQKVVAPVYNIGRPVWEFDPDFDVRNHIREVTLKRGTDSEYKALAGRILSKALPRHKPLWEIVLVRGLKGNRTGFLTRVHHCLADGVSGVELMNVILGPKPSPPPPPGKKLKFPAPPPRDPWGSVVEDLVNSVGGFIEQALTTQGEMLKFAERFLKGNGGSNTANGNPRLLVEMATLAERLCFNNTVHGPQQVAWVEIPLADLKAVKEACACSINDVVLMLVTAAIRRYALQHGDDVKRKLLKIMVPVNLRDHSGRGELGNQISLIPVTVPLDIESPRKLVAAVHETTEFLKRSSVAELVTFAGALIGILPTAFQAVVGPAATQLPITPFNLVCTNVPGPQFPLYLMEHKMLTWYPYVPIGGDMALNVAVLSYNGMVYFGFSGDVNVAPGLLQLEKFIAQSMRELQAAVGKQSRKKIVREKAKAVTARVESVPSVVAGKVAAEKVVPVPAQPAHPEPVQEEKLAVAAVA